jgi:hypothetical protein
MRVSNILRRNGWIKSRKQIGNKREWFWEKVGQEVGQVSKPLPVKVLAESSKKVGQEVGQVSNPWPVTILDKRCPPALPIPSNFLKIKKIFVEHRFYSTNQYNVRNFYKVWSRR